jgi:aminoglycoside phosphotransferase (APT) family kinase protein
MPIDNIAESRRVSKTDYPYLGMLRNEILRRQSTTLIEQYKREVLGWDTALSAAKKFSKGKACSMGQGTGVEGSRVPEIGGTYNLCYWVRVEGVSGEWVVRFPLMGITCRDSTLARMRSEVATMQFLNQHTRVPVPAIIGYCEDDGELPPFIVLESIEGIRLTHLLAVANGPLYLHRIFKDLAAIQLELLSHPSKRIGMLDLGQDPESTVPAPANGPYSMDAIGHEREGILTVKSKPFSSARDYYDYKRDVWTQRLESQQNSISSVADGRRKLLNNGILKDSLDAITQRHDDAGPFYLTHPDLHSGNVILDRHTFQVSAIID